LREGLERDDLDGRHTPVWEQAPEWAGTRDRKGRSRYKRQAWIGKGQACGNPGQTEEAGTDMEMAAFRGRAF
jgi:hypothetical protein